MTALKIIQNNINKPQKRDYINPFSQNEPKTGVLFSNFILQTVNRKAKRFGENYKKNYNTIIFHLQKFTEIFDVNIFTNSVNEEFLDDFIIYLQDLNLKQSYIRNLLSLIKSMVRKAGILGYAIDPSFEDVEIDDENTFKIYLSITDITRIYYFKGLTRYQEQIKDLFVVGCLTGLRYSDYSTLSQLNFQGDFIIKKTKKTGKIVTIPIHDLVREIIEKYNGNINFNFSVQYFNRAIKQICKKIGFTENITFNETIGGNPVITTKPKYELISSHTARRSAATNMYLTGRMKTFEIMSITGHTTEKSFFRYIRITAEDKAKQIANDNFFRK